MEKRRQLDRFILERRASGKASFPYGCAIDANDNLFVSNAGGINITEYKRHPATKAITQGLILAAGMAHWQRFYASFRKGDLPSRWTVERLGTAI